MPRFYMSAGGEGSPDWVWMAAFVWVRISRFREVWRLPAPPRRGSRSAPLGCARRRRCARRTSRLSSSGPGPPRRRGGPVGRRATTTRAAGPTPRQSSRICDRVEQLTTLVLLVDVHHHLSSFFRRTCRAAPLPFRMEGHLAASGPVRISAASGAGNAVPFRTEAPRLGNPPPSPPRRRRQSPPEPSNRRRVASHARRVSAPTPDSIPHASAPPTRNPPRRSLDAQGRTPAGGLQGPRHFFGFFAQCAPRANNAKN